MEGEKEREGRNLYSRYLMSYFKTEEKTGKKGKKKREREENQKK